MAAINSLSLSLWRSIKLKVISASCFKLHVEKRNVKSKRKFVSTITKLEAIKMFDAGKNKKRFYWFGCWRGNSWWLELKSNKNWTVLATEVQWDASRKRKRMRTSDYEKNSKALFVWFTQQRNKGTPINGPVFLEKAVFFWNQFKGEDFTASIGWSDRWKKLWRTWSTHLWQKTLNI